MKNIPVFTTEWGVASLILQEIAYKQEAYIRIQSSEDINRFINECADFCYAAGADTVYVTGPTIPEEYPVYTRIVSMVCNRNLLHETDARLVSVTPQTIEHWRSIYNERMKNVPCSSTMTISDTEKLLDSGTCYFIYRDTELLGIGKITDTKIEAIAGCIPGAGKDLLFALNTAMKAAQIYVEVADQNISAMNLYRSLGFVITEEITKWHCHKKSIAVSNKNT